MVASKLPSSKQIIELLSILKAETPEYPAHLLAVRKTAFLKYAATLKIQGKGLGGEGGQQGGGGSTGTALGGPTTAQGIILQSLIGLGLVATMLVGFLTGNYVIGEKDSGRLNENPAAARESPGLAILPITSLNEIPPEHDPISATPTVTLTVTVTPTVTGTPLVENELDNPALIDDLPAGTKENSGLHLGQTPGTPAAPGQGNPGNTNQPDKPDKQDKLDKPENSESPGKPR